MANSSTGGLVAEPCVIVIFGASGDLTKRKLIPALYDLDRQGRLPKGVCILGTSRTDKTDDAWRAELSPWVKEHSANYDDAKWQAFSKRIFYHAGDAAQPDAFGPMSARIKRIGEETKISRNGGMPNILFYLSTSPNLFEPIIDNIGASGLVNEGRRWCSLDRDNLPWQRIIIEKPFGVDLASTVSLNQCLGRVFDEESTYRIDHYLGKELVQNVLVMRFANSIFEPLWNNNYIDHVQLTAAETVTVGSRAANFYDTAGALRDMIQSHLLQVLTLVAMEPPSSFEAAAIMREKIKIIDCSPTLTEAEVPRFGVFGRYGKGSSGKPDDVAYVDEKGVVESRKTETFAAMRLHFENWRWAGVPFFLRSGKRLASKLTEVVIQFKKPPTNMFARIDPALAYRPPNRLIINIAPREGVSLRIEGKVPGPGMNLDSAKLDLDYLERFGGEVIEAYGPLILDAIRGDRTLYKHRDEVEGGWRVCEPFLTSTALRQNIETYNPGSWGPPGSDALIGHNCPPGVTRTWHNPQAADLR
ncbi:MAG: glucose-6-phosphate dehydrogenase [Phycisphaerae bacterium]|nr:glucose-6-phosphate dehydrogenase [Phycisphaerae bacterium]